ncbi:hypothetical protein MKK88_17660 [Methylobacterium sp. E-005]|uniref:hypothetical protein n=1 Tax=Methylobacterium sp. E-005 TaxID=2836549 RepID=UPI001FB97F07|nr:hypothetical protein [Methylobacterium sp. E-005]MCJ2087793.1 hypothetical protein [Methylobacterium sp. E-005]
MADEPIRPGSEADFTVLADANKDRERVKLVHNERTKLSATMFNNVATAFFVGGGVAPMLGVSSASPSPWQLALGPVWLLVGFVLHFGARLILRSLK